MTIGYLLLLTSLVAFGLLGIFHKVADHPQCRPKMIAVILLFWGGILTAIYTLLFNPKGLQIPAEVLLYGSLGGTIAAAALFVFQTGLKFGKISTSWLIINLSMSVPISLSIFFFGESINLNKGLGILLVFAAIVLMWWDKKMDLEKSGSDLANVAMANKSKWLPLMMLSFLGNGLAASSQKLLVEAGASDYTWQFYIVLYWSGFVLMTLHILYNTVFASKQELPVQMGVRTSSGLAREVLPNQRELITGLIMAVCSVIGNVSVTLALAKIPGAVAYPVGNGGSLTLVVLAGVLFFREKIHHVGIAGIVCGISAILILVLA